jgi:frataxin-like iron-binding protein CyaY
MCLEYGKMLIEITLKPISQWMTIIEPNTLSPYYGKRVAPYRDIIPELIGIQYPNEKFHFYLNTNVSFLEKDELDKILASSHDYLIEQIDEVVLNDIVGDTAAITINKRQGLKEIWLFGRRNDSYSRNDYINYTTETTTNELQVPYEYLNSPYTPISFLQQYWRFYYMDMKQIPVSHIIQSFRIMIDDKERTTDLTREYTGAVQPYQAVLNNYLPMPGLLYYSFSLNPEEFQPSGFYNFARVNNAQIQLKLTQRPPPRPIVSTLQPNVLQYISQDTGEFKPYVRETASNKANFAWMFQIRAELVFYNILRIKSGICEVLLRK